MRSEPRHFVYSKVMAWVALDRGIKAAEELPCDGGARELRQPSFLRLPTTIGLMIIALVMSTLAAGAYFGFIALDEIIGRCRR